MIIIQTHVIPATTFRGTRIAAVSNTGRRLVVAMDYSESNPHEAAGCGLRAGLASAKDRGDGAY